MKIFGMCIDKRIVAGVAVAGLGLWWLVPGALAAALPFLLLAICPLSMVLMMKAMNASGSRHGGADHAERQHMPDQTAPTAPTEADAGSGLRQQALPSGSPADEV